MVQVEVTEQDIRDGVAGDCFRCAVARALARATGDDHANVYERDFQMRIEIWARSIPAPQSVREFVVTFDEQPRADSGHLDRTAPGCMPPTPFCFTIPDSHDPQWQEQCYLCEELCDPLQLDDEGACLACQRKDGE